MKTNRWFKWILNYSLGELAGIGAAATIGRALFIEFSNTGLDQTPFLFFFILVLAGATEGSIIGYIQWRSLSRLTALQPVRWVLVTTTATIISWLLILPPSVVFISFLSSLKLIDNYHSLIYVALAGIAFGGIIGVAQFFIIRKIYRNALMWVVGTIFGWMLSFIVVYVALLLLSYTSSVIENIFIMIIACALSGFLQGLIVGWTLNSSMRRREELSHVISAN